MISSFCKSMYLSYFRFQSNAWQDESVIFFHSQVSQWRRCEFFLIYLFKRKQVLLKSKSLPLKTIRVLQRILTIFVESKELSTASPLIFAESRRWHRAVFKWGTHFLEPTCLPKKRIPFLHKHRILATMLMTQDVLIEEIISSFWENIYFELFSFSIKRAARRGWDIFTHKSHNGEVANFFLFCFIFSIREKKQVLLELI